LFACHVKLKVTWDEPLNNENVATGLKNVQQLTVSRCYFDTHISHPSIHCFANASRQAYGAIVFFVQGKRVSFIIAKTHATPLKAFATSCLELMATPVH